MIIRKNTPFAITCLSLEKTLKCSVHLSYKMIKKCHGRGCLIVFYIKTSYLYVINKHTQPAGYIGVVKEKYLEGFYIKLFFALIFDGINLFLTFWFPLPILFILELTCTI